MTASERAEGRLAGSGGGRQRSLLFDLDGTLVDSLPDLAGALNLLRGELDMAPLDRTTVAAMVGDGVPKLVERGLGWAETAPPEAAERRRLLARYLALYEARLTAETRPFPGVPETLARLNEDGWRLAVCTNKPEAASRALLTALGLDRLFETVGGGDSFAERKPAAGHLLATLARMAAPAEGAVMVGDGPNDLLAARNAGLPAVLVSYGYSRVPVGALGADALIDRFGELPAALAGLNEPPARRGPRIRPGAPRRPC
ncbi:MAG: phosphoglycolate phosphatase [Rhodospirillales bacterium]|nr:phosphoglycolate phosphatase [Rhodospirillales bacterium]